MSRIMELSTWIVAACAVVALLLPSPVRAQEQGIDMHGHWVIEVRNADGSLDVRHEFENALTANGQQVLADLLGRVRVMELWRVGLTTTGTSGTVSFFIHEPASSLPDSPTTSTNLTVSSDAESVVLQGSFVSTVDADVQNVFTGIEFDSGSFLPTFTTAGVSAITIQTTQIVSVTVTLTFS